MHHPTDRIAHTTAFFTPVVEHWLEREIAQWVHHMKDRSDDPSHHERTPLPRSYISLPKECQNQNASKPTPRRHHFDPSQIILLRLQYGCCLFGLFVYFLVRGAVDVPLLMIFLIVCFVYLGVVTNGMQIIGCSMAVVYLHVSLLCLFSGEVLLMFLFLLIFKLFVCFLYLSVVTNGMPIIGTFIHKLRLFAFPS